MDARSFMRLVILFAAVANVAATLVIGGEQAILPYVGARTEDQVSGSALASELDAYGRAVERLHVAVGANQP